MITSASFQSALVNQLLKMATPTIELTVQAIAPIHNRPVSFQSLLQYWQKQGEVIITNPDYFLGPHEQNDIDVVNATLAELKTAQTDRIGWLEKEYGISGPDSEREFVVAKMLMADFPQTAIDRVKAGKLTMEQLALEYPIEFFDINFD